MELTPSLVAGIPKNGPTDPIDFYRRPAIGWLFRERINRGLRLLGGRRFSSALEVGYGSGAVQLVLAQRAEEVHGIDLDADPALVAPILERRGVSPNLRRGDVLSLPYEDGNFDLVVCFSVIEHIRGFEKALTEMARVLTADGRLLLGMPSVNRTMELGFRAIGFKGIDDHHVTTPREVIGAFAKVGLEIADSAFLDLPLPAPLGLRLYHDWLLRKTRA